MKVQALIGAFVLLVSLSFPLSAGALGHSPSSSEVNQTAATTTGDLPGTPQAVPEPSSVTLLAAAVGMIAALLLKRRFGQTVRK